MSSTRFSGHETFNCKHFWLKKGYDFVQSNREFKDADAVVALGVGKNMVSSINFWMKAFALLDEDNSLSEISYLLFDSEKGYDPYLEDLGTQWLLHFHLLTKNYSSIYYIVFDEFRKTRVSSEFTTKQLHDFLLRKLKKEGETVSENTIEGDIKVFIKNYISLHQRGSKSLEDDFSSILTGLKLITFIQGIQIDHSQLFKIEYTNQPSLDPLIFFYGLKTIFPNEVSISVVDIQSQLSDLFLCNREGTDEKLFSLQDSGLIVYKENAGRKEIQIKSKIELNDILKNYYEQNI